MAYSGTGVGNTGTGTGSGIAANVKSHIPGTAEHSATHPTSHAHTGGAGGIGQQVKEHIPGTTENKVAHSGYATGGHHTGAGAGTGGGIGAAIGAAGHHGHGTHTGTGAAGMTKGSTVDTGAETLGDKVKKIIPGTTENKIHKSNKAGAGGVGGNAAY
ncbi:hypothetical protein COCSUDRAFT_41244 [Coccomyxa subellipsoidea C-169]|uniref:Uncharacterized protein n=1 Tax=Coccomyxa subellipsoidea (strain C-169) TaxID=574566 RepID=I0YZR5_COCSC|nr:hypothetical protein COCSUDRAFT_41244 [Coccomyxa subellipsoidea C-169]EIE23884.1 hypothetical protein COCSUDRAFT_41244 [Coccomyxa subellipsoidea C-169]|eukprot:XP_005648428.1 hypothetical protein COCSUDRAFT_41244 [Coccomyxa subellipsoidea C-169]